MNSSLKSRQRFRQKSRQKSRRNFRKKTKYGGQRKYTYAHKKRRRARSRRRTKIRGGANDQCKDNPADSLIRKQECDDVEGDIEKDKIGKNKGYCSGKYCISEDTINGIIGSTNHNRRYKDPFTRKEYTRDELPEKFKTMIQPSPPPQRRRLSFRERIAAANARRAARHSNSLGTIEEPIIDDDL